MDLKEVLVQKPREDSGSRTANRYEFQKNWALCKLLEIHDISDNYLMIFDFHDDVVILDSDINPKKAKFYQIKSKESGKITLSNLTSKNKQKYCVLTKLYYNKVIFKKFVQKLTLVSNAKFHVELHDKSKKANKLKNICFDELSKECKDKILDKISNELDIKKEDIDGKIIFLNVTKLGYLNHEDVTKSEISKFLENRDSEIEYTLGLIYSTLYDEINEKTTYEENIDSYNDLIKLKSISKKKFEEIIDTIIKTYTKEPDWSSIDRQLENIGYSLSDRKTLKENFLKYRIERMDPTNYRLVKIRKKIRKILKEKSNVKFNNYKDLIDKIIDIYDQRKEEDEPDRNYIISIILMEYNEND